VSQPNPSEYPEPDPLLAFFEEAADPQPVESPDPVQQVKPQENEEDPPAPGATEAEPELRRRLERAEHQIDRTLIDIITLKSDLATLVSAVDDITKRMSRPLEKPNPVAALPSRQPPWRRAVAAIGILLTAGAVLWGLSSVTTSDLAEPPLVKIEKSSAVEAPAIVEPPAPPAPVVMTAAGSADASPAPARAAPARPAPASGKGSRLRQDYGGQAGAAGSRVVTYVGTLTVDAEPAGDVYLNRKNVGRTPVRLEDLRAGSHLIWIEREGYRRWTRVVPVAADRMSRVSATLDPLPR
jgi:hypothetical protein